MKTSKLLVCTLIAAAAMIPTAYAATDTSFIDTEDSNLKAYWNFDTSNALTAGSMKDVTDAWKELPAWNEDGYGVCTTGTTHPYTQKAGLKAAEGFTVSFDINDFGNGTLLSMTSGAMNQAWRSISISNVYDEDAGTHKLTANFHGDPSEEKGDFLRKTISVGTTDWTTLTLVGSVSSAATSTLVLDFYVDGVHVGQSTKGNATNITGDNVINNMQFGYYGTSSSSASTNIDNILVYNKAFTATEVAGLQTLTWTGGTDWTTATWKNGTKENATFTNGNNVVFNGATIEVKEDVIAGNITVSGQTKITLGAGSSLSVKSLSVGDKTDDRPVGMEMGADAKLNIIGSGTVTLGAIKKTDESTGGNLVLDSSSVNLVLTDKVDLNRMTVGTMTPTTVSIDFGTDGLITSATNLNFGQGTKSFTFTVALSVDQLSLLEDPGMFSRTLLKTTSNSNQWGGIWNLGSNENNTEFHALSLIFDNVNSVPGYTNLGIIRDTQLAGYEDKNWFGLVFYENGGSDYVDFVVNTIPEPSMFGLLAGLGALALVGTRRRRRK